MTLSFRLPFLATLAFISLFSVAVLSGCQSSSSETEHLDDIPLDRRIGIVRSLGGATTTSQGTHLLQLDDGDTILLRSLAINLDDGRYANVMVEVRGALNYSKDGKPLMDVMNIDVLDQPEFLIDNSPQWKSYSSSALGFSLQYRDDLTLIEKSNGVSFERSRITGGTGTTQETSASPSRLVVHRFSVSVTNVSTNTESSTDEEETLLEYLETVLPSGQASSLQATRIGAEAVDAYKAESPGSATFYARAEGGPLYTLVLDFGSDDESSSDQQIFYEMLGNFRLGSASGADSSGTRQGESSTTQEALDSPETDSEQDNEVSAVNVTVPDNFGLFESDTLKFSVGYPKQWYFTSAPSSESGVSRRYDFGGKSAESTEDDLQIETAVSLDILSTPASGSSSVKAGDKTFTTSSAGGNVSVYVTGKSGKVYRITGASSQENTLLQMALTLEEK